MAQITLEFDPKDPEEVRHVYLSIVQLVNTHFPPKKVENQEQEKSE